MTHYDDPNLYAEILKYYQHYYPQLKPNHDRITTGSNNRNGDSRGHSRTYLRHRNAKWGESMGND